MKTKLLVMMLGIGAALAVQAAPDVDPAKPGEVDQLVAQMGAPSFAERQRADDRLRAGSRALRPLLEQHRDHPDPEVRMRVRRIIDHLRWSPEKVPQAAWVFSPKGSNEWAAALEKWRQEPAKMEFEQTVGDTTELEYGELQFAAQSFVPTNPVIRAVEIGIQPPDQADTWWFLVEIREGNVNKPGSYVLSRTWLRTELSAPVSTLNSLVVPLPETPVTPGAFHWIVYAAFRGPAPARLVALPVRFSKADTYPEGRLLANGYRQGRGDLQFRLWSTCPPVPETRAATVEERAVLPDMRPIERSMRQSFEW